jgi:micrococcal nuclease
MAQSFFEGQPRPRRRLRRRSWGILLLLLVLAVAVYRGWDGLPPDGRAPPLETLSEGTYSLVRVVDGDTIIVAPLEPRRESSGPVPQARLRLLGVDTPETVQPGHPVEPWGAEATAFTKEFLASSQPLEIRLDRRRKDRYGRFLAYVYVDGRMLNEELVRAGLAEVVDYPGDSPQIKRVLRQAEEEARDEQRGLWSEGKASRSRRK